MTLNGHPKKKGDDIMVNLGANQPKTKKKPIPENENQQKERGGRENCDWTSVTKRKKKKSRSGWMGKRDARPSVARSSKRKEGIVANKSTRKNQSNDGKK